MSLQYLQTSSMLNVPYSGKGKHNLLIWAQQTCKALKLLVHLKPFKTGRYSTLNLLPFLKNSNRWLTKSRPDGTIERSADDVVAPVLETHYPFPVTTQSVDQITGRGSPDLQGRGKRNEHESRN